MIFHFLGQSGFFVQVGDHKLLIDPFLTGNGRAVDKPEDFSPDYIMLSHGHGDHYGDTEAIAGRSGATVVSSFEIATYVGNKGLKSHGMNIGGGHDFPFGRVVFTPAWHSNSLPDGSYGGMPMGIVLEAEGKRVYHAGDTALFSDMALVGRTPLDLALLPIGDNYTMGPDDALEAVKLLNPKRVVPIHYNTFPLIEQDAEAFKTRVESETDAKVTVLAPGERLEL
jgi:L-ascorbate metabolism protein UlaG (beta-lactamase superfamily)